MVKLFNLLKVIGLVALLAELRMLDRQPGYRYCMAWLLVLFAMGANSFLAWLIVTRLL